MTPTPTEIRLFFQTVSGHTIHIIEDEVPWHELCAFIFFWRMVMRLQIDRDETVDVMHLIACDLGGTNVAGRDRSTTKDFLAAWGRAFFLLMSADSAGVTAFNPNGHFFIPEPP